MHDCLGQSYQGTIVCTNYHMPEPQTIMHQGCGIRAPTVKFLHAPYVNSAACNTAKRHEAHVKAEDARKLSMPNKTCVNQRTAYINGAKRKTPRVYFSNVKYEAQRVCIVLAEREVQRTRVLKILHDAK